MSYKAEIVKNDNSQNDNSQERYFSKTTAPYLIWHQIMEFYEIY